MPFQVPQLAYTSSRQLGWFLLPPGSWSGLRVVFVVQLLAVWRGLSTFIA